jgi:RHH-type proline utilization regulon transcriptional repressor/proline dehydrogenase/delta 1-pyrroline-5-carboxylate dehydrogenase
VRRSLSELRVAVAVESDDEWIARMAASPEDAILEADAAPRASRVRLVGPRDAVAALHRALAEATGGDPDLAVYDGEVTSAGRIELLPFVHEQAITITAHRFGNPDDWSADVI